MEPYARSQTLKNLVDAHQAPAYPARGPFVRSDVSYQDIADSSSTRHDHARRPNRNPCCRG